MTKDVLVQASNLHRHYGRHHAVAGVSIRLHQGEVLGLLGPNGAGKSTTMQMLTGNIAPGRGQIIIAGIDLLDDPREAKQHIGYLPEQPPVYRDMTVLEYLRYCAKLHGLTSTRISSAVDFAMQRCGLTEVGKRLIGNLSKGFQQRTGIAQAILHQPSVVILDEPTVGLDPIQIKEIRKLIRELGNDHGVILSTHILPEVKMVCDRVQIITHGKTAFEDTLEGLERRHG
ncbi:MAG: ABC transporter ATP-binding protein, partial [Thiotrichaceae bacterium]